jgi:transposase
MQEPWMKKIVEEIKKEYGPVEIKKIGHNYYVYRVSSVYDKEKKRAKKISGEYIGRITMNGLEKKKTPSTPRSVFEYGNARILFLMAKNIIPDIQRLFPLHWKEILAISITKTIMPVPIKYLESAWSKLYLSREIDASLSPNTISEKLRSIGSDWNSQREFYRMLIGKKSVIFLDLSSIFSYSENIRLAEKGYNKDHKGLRQINFALLFSDEPVMLKAMPGSVRDVKYFSSVIEEFDLRRCIIIMDRGFFSMDNIEEMNKKGMKFIQPLRRNSKIIDYSIPLKESFVYRDRGIRYGVKKIGSYYLYLYEDVKMKGEEYSNLIEARVKGNKVKIEESRLGKIPIISNLLMDGDKIYDLYKERADIEQAFDAMKNELENDKTYLQDDDSLRGYFFITFVSLYLYFRVMNIIKKAELTKELSVNELLLELSRIYIQEYTDGKRAYTEIPKKVENIISKLNIEILPKI